MLGWAKEDLFFSILKQAWCIEVVGTPLYRVANRMKPFMTKIIKPNQSAFIPGRSIADNILLSQDLVKNFHRPKGTLRMCLKLDFSKAFDSINWVFVKSTL